MSADQAVPPSGVVTFLFTDIEGSTRRWESDADGMREALFAHDDVLRTAIEGHGGFLFKHTGDGVCAVFSSPKSAVDAAVAAQRRVQLPVRMGLATGEAELQEGDYFGSVLNRAARVMAAGHGGQILLAESTASLLGGVDLVDLGPRRLRDLPTPVGMFQVRGQGLRSDFPPLQALDVSPGNLRPQTTSIVGRESELAEIKGALKNHRLVTLTGVGGVGKTRLALELAAQLAGEFPDGVWVFELAAVADPDAVPDAVASVLGITQQLGKSVSESVAAALAGRTRLLVFDNCEHVLDAATDLVEAILGQSATVTILATSREGLRVADGQLWPVPSLDVGAGIDSAAVSLFVERAQAVSPRFSISNADEAGAVVEICRRLDGIPLAIELAASRMALMTAIEVGDRLDQRFRLLVGSRRGLERHQTLRHAVAWSYDLLDNAERTVLDRCSVFAGGFDLESACSVTDSDDEFATLELLDALVLALAVLGSLDEAVTTAAGLIDAAEATRNPYALSYALLAHGLTYRDADPVRALDACHRGLVIAQDSGNRANESHLATSLARQEAEYGDPLAALDYLTLAIRNYHDAGNVTIIRSPLSSLAAFLDRLGRYEPAATIAGFAFSPLTEASIPEIGTAVAHLREVLGDQTYESLARKGETMTTAAMATYAYDQIDQARTELNAVSK